MPQLNLQELGEHGRGFAVVSEEIGKLSVLTKENTKDITLKINDLTDKLKLISVQIDKNLNTTMELINGVKKFGESVDKVGVLAQKDLNLNLKVQKDADEIINIISKVSDSVNEQKTAWDEITRNVGEMNNVVQSNAGNAEELSAGADSLKNMTIEISRIIKNKGE